MKKKLFKFKFDKNSFNVKKPVRKVFSFWIKHRKAIFIIILLAVCGAGIYLFYKNLYEERWSHEDEIQYINSQRQDVNFKEDKFRKVMEEIERRERAYESEFQPVNNIFKPLGE